jgi:hypothetical protein
MMHELKIALPVPEENDLPVGLKTALFSLTAAVYNNSQYILDDTRKGLAEQINRYQGNGFEMVKALEKKMHDLLDPDKSKGAALR